MVAHNPYILGIIVHVRFDSSNDRSAGFGYDEAAMDDYIQKLLSLDIRGKTQ